MAPSSKEPVSLRTWIAVLGTILGAFMAVLEIQITNASLREITGGIAATSVEASWVSTSYLIGEIITIPLTAWLGRVFGTRLYLLVNVFLFLFFSGLVPLSVLATAGLLREQQGDGSAIFNIIRNLGGSVGTALLSTMITQREQFHDFRIGERVTAYNPYVQQFLSNQSVQNLQHSGDPVTALQQAYRMLQASVQTNSYVMAYSECFLALGVILLVGSATIWLCKKTKAGAAAAAH